jgi:hypothetical protein
MKAPQSSYYPPGKRRFLKGDIYSVPSRDFHALNKKSKNSKLEAVLTSVASVLFNRTDDLETKITNTICITYYLDDTDRKFAKMCKDKGARMWFENAYKKRKHVYMVTAIQTLTGASMELTDSKAGEAKGSGTLPASKLLGNPIPASLGDAKVLVEHRTEKHMETGFVAEGEQIYAIQYRKVKFGLFSSRNMDEAYLEEGNRWKVMWKTMGAKEEENDVLEVTLVDADEPLEETDGVSTCTVDGLDVLYIAE